MSSNSASDLKPDGKPSHDEHDALPPGTRLAEFELLRVLGVGGFGIVYLAQDHALERLVAIKEYMPSMMAARGEGSQVTLRSSLHTDTFGIGLRSFVNEAKLLARFNHPSLVRVYRFWEANGTAYMAMPYYPGRTLRDTRRAMNQVPDEGWVRGLIDPLLGALEVLHKEDVYHRDIAPDNILLLPDGPPVLLDFGAARSVIGDRTQNLTAVLKPSYAPIEQYADVGHLRQGAWTDIYALGAVLHFVVTGRPPSPAASRAVHDDYRALSSRSPEDVGTLPLKILKAIDWALTVSPHTRPQSVQQFRDAFEGRETAPDLTIVDIGSPSSVAAHAPLNSPSAAPAKAPEPLRPTAAAGSSVGSGAVANGFEATAPGPLAPTGGQPPAPPPPPSPPSRAAAAAPQPEPSPPAAAAPVTPRRSSRATPPGMSDGSDLGVQGAAADASSRRTLWWLGALVVLVVALLVGAYLAVGQRGGALPAAAPASAPLQAASAPLIVPPAQPAEPSVPAAATPIDPVPTAASMPAIKVPDWSARPAAASAPAASAASAVPQDKPAKVKVRPTPASAPASQASAGPSPKELCDARASGSFASCMRPLCSKRQYFDHPQCVQLRRDEEW